MPAYEQKLYSFIDAAIRQRASDIHLTSGRYPVFRVDGVVVPFVQGNVLSVEDIDNIAKIMLSENDRFLLEKNRTVDFSFTYQNKTRFRINAYYQYNSLAFAMRIIPSEIMTLDQLKLPSVIGSFANYKQGLVLITGPTGSGKSTTLSVLIETINQNRAEHIVTLEDPIERVFTPKKSIIEQREIGRDATDFQSSFRSLFRQDADIVMIGDMRDIETMTLAMSVAETGHLVFVCVHTNSASQTIDRIINSFPADEQNQVRSQLALTLVGVVSQVLIPSIQGGRVPAVEVLFSNSAVRNMIRLNKTQDIDIVIETGKEQGMISMQRALSQLIYAEEISEQTAKHYSFGRLKTA